MNKEELQDIARNIILEESIRRADDNDFIAQYGVDYEYAEKIRELIYSANINVSWDE